MPVFHLKYRPVLITELDSTRAADSLRKILVAKEMPQSFLFAGPKGSGKTSAARILARSINCKSGKSGEACGKCEICKSILDGREMDIIEIDAASNRGIEDVRSLKEKAYLMPSRLSRKVFIIDEVHMLTKDAFNALLKIIEEPPKHTMFILCTTGPEKIPETVLSRLTRIDFRKGNKEELLGSLEKVIKGEKLKIDKKVTDFLVDKSDGSFRNLHRDFNELILNLGEKITFDIVEKFYKDHNGHYSESEFEIDLVGKKLKLILEKVEGMSKLEVDFQAFCERLLIYFQEKLLLSCGVGEGDKSPLERECLERLVKFLMRAIKEGKDVEIGQLPLELAVIDFIKEEGGEVGGERKEVREDKSEENQEKQEKKEFKAVVEKKEEVKVTEEKKEEEVKVVEKKEEELIKEEVLEERQEKKVFIGKKTCVDLSRIENLWGNVLLAVKPFNHSVEAFLRATKPFCVEDGVLVLEVFYPFHKDRLEESKNRRIVEEGLSKIFGTSLSFKCVLSKNKKSPLVIDNKTPVENINEELVDVKGKDKGDLYDVAKDIFG